MNLTEKLKQDIRSHAADVLPIEACGVVIRKAGALEYVRCRNIATQGIEHFIISPDDYEAAEQLGEVLAIVHSHPNGRAIPSQADLSACEATGLPWVIIGWPVDEFHVFGPSGYVAPLKGREFCHGVQDCYTLVRDFYRINMGITLPDYARIGEWWREGKNLYLDNLADAGFQKVAGAPEYGDMIVMQVKANVGNHAAIYLGDDRILHHLNGRLSAEDVYGGYWKKHTLAICRHKDRHPQG